MQPAFSVLFWAFLVVDIATVLLRCLWVYHLAYANSNQSTVKEINPEHSLEGLMLKLQYFGHLMQTANSLGKTEGKRSGQQRRRWLDSITSSMGMNMSKLQGKLKM